MERMIRVRRHEGWGIPQVYFIFKIFCFRDGVLDLVGWKCLNFSCILNIGFDCLDC